MVKPDMTLLDRRVLFHKPDWVAAIIRDCAAKHGVRVSDILRKPCRHRPVVRARHEAIYRVKAAKPHLSAGRIGTWFHRDHTTILYALAKYQATHRVTELTTLAKGRAA